MFWIIKNNMCIRERPLMTSLFRVGRGGPKLPPKRDVVE